MRQRAAPIESVVLDIGHVLVRLQPKRLLQLLDVDGQPGPELERLLGAIGLQAHECGQLSGQGLLGRLLSLAPGPLSRAAVHAAWCDMFELQPRMVALARRLAVTQRVFLLSNIGDLHWMHLSRQYQLHRLGEASLPSFLAGVMKPAAGIYAEAERRFGLDPARTVFIDDRAENIEAARQRGWHGIVHADYASTLAALVQLGVRESLEP